MINDTFLRIHLLSENDIARYPAVKAFIDTYNNKRDV